MISQSVSENNVSLIIRKEGLPRVLRALRTELLHEDPEGLRGPVVNPDSSFSRIECEDDVSVIAVLGRGMSGTPGIAARVFSTVAKEGINIKMIAQGSSEINISFVIKDKERAKAVLALHQEFGLGHGLIEETAPARLSKK
jgi:aspartate kinase